MMTEIEINPTFDPSDCIWFTDDGVEAKSLAELQRKLQQMLPEGDTIKIVGYMPNGYGPVIRPRTSPQVAKVSLTPAWATPRVYKRAEQEEAEEPAAQQEPRVPGSPRVSPQPSKFERIDWSLQSNRDKLKDLVEKCYTSGQIARKFGCTPGAIIGACNRLKYRLQGQRQRVE